jgi:hypothetical protein
VVTTGSMISVAMGTELSNVAVGSVTVIGGGVGVGGEGVAVGVDVGVGTGGVAVGDGVAVGPVPVIVIRPLGVEGSYVLKFVSAKIRLSGAGCQANGLVAPGVLLTLRILRLKRVPDPESAVLPSNA